MSYRRKSILAGALTLTLASIITRVLGFVYRIYMSNAIGAEGMGLYQLIMPVYGLTWSITCSGFTTTISKLVAQENAKKQYGNMGRILKLSLLITGAISLAVALLMFFFAGFIGNDFLKDGRTVLPIKILAAAVPFMAAGSCIRGYFLGLQESAVPAFSQVLEQCIRMAGIYILAATFIPRGLSYACAAAVIGIFLGEFISFIYMFVSYKYFKAKNKLTNKPAFSTSHAMGLIMSMSLPLTLNRISGSLLGTVENALIPQRLMLFGMSQKEAISAYGRITGMALPLIFFPSALLVALSVSLVPAVSEAMAVKNSRRISTTVSKSLRLTSLIAMGACIIFLVLPDELGQIIYKQDISEILFLLGIMCPFWYLGTTFGGILNGLGQQVFIFRNSILASVINILCVYFLVPLYGITAFIAGWFVSLIIVTVLDMLRIRECANIHIPVIQWFAKPALAALATGLSAEYLCNNLIFPNFRGAVGLAISIISIAMAYFLFALLTGSITKGEVLSLVKIVPPFKTLIEKLE